MKKHPFRLALIIVGVVFLFFFVSVLVLASLFGTSPRLPSNQKVAVIPVQGPILVPETVVNQLIDFREDDGVKAIVLRVNSPGGGVGPSQEIAAEVEKTAAVKPVVVSMGTVAASGGYYISAPAHEIFANPGTLTGSIGVIMEFTNIEDLLSKVGLQSQVIKSGEMKDVGSAVRPMTDQDRTVLQGIIDDVHQQFVDFVAKGRKMDPAVVGNLADGRVYTGRQALANGLIDKLGTLQDAIAAAGNLGGIEGEPDVVYPPEPEPRWIQYLFSETAAALRESLPDFRGSAGLNFIWNGFEGR
ncbi:MAG: signal peptide peptidase SppA [Desulfuromonas sp.]|nr:MAG: signal peptide peptidase SppA [Desulfuromonas sp.]